MVPQSGRKGLWPDNRFSMNPAKPDSLYHSAARPGSVRAFVSGTTEKCFCISPERYYTIKIAAEEKNDGAAKRQEGPLARQSFFDESGKAGFIIP